MVFIKFSIVWIVKDGSLLFSGPSLIMKPSAPYFCKANKFHTLLVAENIITCIHALLSFSKTTNRFAENVSKHTISKKQIRLCIFMV
jgi:hypothetical protein